MEQNSFSPTSPTLKPFLLSGNPYTGNHSIINHIPAASMSNSNENSQYPSAYSIHQMQDHNILLSSSEGFVFPIITQQQYSDSPFTTYGHNPQLSLQNPRHEYHTSFSVCLQAEGEVEYNQLSCAFDLSCSSSEFAAHKHDNSSNEVVREAAAGRSGNGVAAENISPAPNSSLEAGVEEYYSKKKKDLHPGVCEEAGDGKSKKDKAKKKDPKKVRELRFAFKTKSEVDNMEDGYRWRKYGQKTVKNSPFPRSYYRCTSQMCGVKKRIERSFQDPTVVITTYEGQHNHQSPITMGGNVAAMMAPSLFSLPRFHSFPRDLFLPSTSMTTHRRHHPNTTCFADLIHPHQQQTEHHELPDQFGLFPDMAAADFFHKPQP